MLLKTLNDYCKVLEINNWSQRLLKFSLIAYMSAVLERKVWINQGAADPIFPDILMLFVAYQTAMKTTIANLPSAIFSNGANLDDKKWKYAPIKGPSRGSISGYLEALENANKQCRETYNTDFFPTSPLYIVAGEFQTFYTDVGGGHIKDLLLEIFDSKSVGEPYRYQTRKYGEMNIYGPCITLIGCTTPDNLQKSRFLEAAGSGLASRFIIVADPNPAWGVSVVKPFEDIEAMKRIRSDIQKMNLCRGEYKIAKDVQAWYDDTWIEGKKAAQHGRAGDIMSYYYARKDKQTKCLALISACLRNDPEKTVRVEDMQAALTLLESIEDDIPWGFGVRTVFRDDDYSELLLKMIPSDKPVTLGEILMNGRKAGVHFPTDSSFQSVLQSLTLQGVVSVITQTINGKEASLYVKKS